MLSLKRVPVLLLAAGAAGAADRPRANPDEILKQLQAGNRRFAAGTLSHPNQSAARRLEAAKGQDPAAVILSCSDSRVPPELIFDQGLGDLFVIRIAGNIATNEALGSIQYALEHFSTSLVIVLGHERCGAVDATLKGGQLQGHVATLVEAIRPAVEGVKGQGGDTLDLAVKANIQRVVGQLRTARPVLAGLVSKGAVKVAGAVYDLDTGTVTLLP
jgi:carbonic anhydrase